MEVADAVDGELQRLHEGQVHQAVGLGQFPVADLKLVEGERRGVELAGVFDEGRVAAFADGGQDLGNDPLDLAVGQLKAILEAGEDGLAFLGGGGGGGDDHICKPCWGS